MEKRGQRVAPPARKGEWEIRFADKDAAAGWEDLVRQAPGPTREAFDKLSIAPCDRSNPKRQCRLKGELGSAKVGGVQLEQWQYEVTGAGRIWYCPDQNRKIVHLTRASTGHPKETE